MKWKKIRKIAFIAFIGSLLAAILIFQIFGYDFEISRIREFVESFGIWAPLIFILLYILGTIFIPSTPFMALAGILFGFQHGLIYTLIGGLWSALIVFLFSRKIGKEEMEEFLSNKKRLRTIEKYNKRLERGGMLDLLILRITPIMPFNILNMLMGISKIKARDYVIGTILGLIPSHVLTVYFGGFISTIL